MEGATLEGMTALVLELQDEVKRLREALGLAQKLECKTNCVRGIHGPICESYSEALSQKGADVWVRNGK